MPNAELKNDAIGNVGRKKPELARSRKVRVMVFGTFDVIHPGHIHFFRQARKLARNPYLIVSVARDINVSRIKGRAPLYNEKQRAASLKKLPEVDKVVMGDKRGYLRHILMACPHVIALGYDQEAYTGNLEKNLKIKIVRLKSYMPHKYKSSLIKRFYARNNN